MARTNLPVTNLVANSGVALSTTAVDQANGMNLQLASSAIPAASTSESLVLVVANTAASPFNVIIRAGASNPPAFRAGLGDITVSVTNATTKYLGPFDYARVVQSDGSLNIDFGVGFTGTIQALLVPGSTN
ncbi:MAG TPA: hypothetical protein VFN78_02495 [Ktedonobacterales bacterium]|nr:hypothetical protein [Ktedonobacterales bacterium]